MTVQEKIEKLHQKVYDFLLYIYPLLAKYPKYEKFTLQKETRCTLLGVLSDIIKYRKTGTKSHLYSADVQLQTAKEYIRLAHDLKYSAMNSQHYGTSWTKLKEIGEELGDIIEQVKSSK